MCRAKGSVASRSIRAGIVQSKEQSMVSGRPLWIELRGLALMADILGQ